MKSLILYETKTGTSENCARLIAENNRVENIYKLSNFTNDLIDFETITLVSPIYMGQINKKVRSFIDQNPIHLNLVLVGTNEKTYNDTIQNTFDESTLKRLNITYVGGAYNFDKLNFLQRFIIKKMTGITETTDLIKYDVLQSITC